MQIIFEVTIGFPIMLLGGKEGAALYRGEKNLSQNCGAGSWLNYVAYGTLA